ncbi:MAG: hypothetical protein F4210_09965 [Holophagales bacterium]|nr:hypothetical protein [Holophagales bacterium]MYF95816.1 hypothetical protein [Holophagales bacterium]
MPEHGVRSRYSNCPFQVRVRDKDRVPLSAASAFFFETGGASFLVTNWHVVSGRHFLNGEPLACPFVEPIRLTAKLSSYEVGDRARGRFGVAPHDVPLYDGEKPVWFEHPELGSSCDVVAIPMGKPASCPDWMHKAANRIDEPNIPVKPGCTVFVIGFPQALSVGFGLPLWKSGYIASEPHYDVELGGQLSDFGGQVDGSQVPAFFIDSQTRAGMSGAPVFARHFQPWDMKDPYGGFDMKAPGFWKRDDVVLMGSGTQFVGCYSGRAGSKESEAALGLCWRTDVIEAICQERKPGRNPHFQHS